MCPVKQCSRINRYVRTAGRWSVLAASVLLLYGCGGSGRSVSGKRGAYDAYYRAGLSSLPELTYATLRENGDAWAFAKPYQEVRGSVLTVVSQYDGILSMQSDDSQCVMLVVKAREQNLPPENEVRTATFGGFNERWLAVGVRENEETHDTEVVVADISPSTGRLSQGQGISELLRSQVQVQLSQPTWHAKFVGFNSPKDAEHADDITELPDKERYRYAELEDQLGDWLSKRMQVDLLTVDCPEATLWLEGIVRRLKHASDLQALPTRVIVVNSRQLNAFALPNGDIFVASGLLDCLESEDEVAAVLAHELDHLAHHDVINRLKVKGAGEASANAIRVAAALGDMAVAMFGGSSDLGTAIVTDVARAGGKSVIERGAGHLEMGMISGYSADIELRADKNGTAMLYAAKYDADASIDMLCVLKKYQAEAEGRSELCRSNLINMEPGLDERIKVLNGFHPEVQ